MKRFASHAAASFAVLALVTLTARAHATADAVDTTRSTLADSRFRFCHEKDYPLTPQEHAWCPLVGEQSASCPELPHACTLPAVDLIARERGGAWTKGGGTGPSPQQDDKRKRTEPEPSLTLPDMSGFAQVLFIALLITFVVLVLRAIVTNVLRDRSAPEPESPPPPGAPTPDAAPVRSQVETDVERLIARARASAGRGEYARAIDDAYAALLRRLDGDGLIEIHPSRTNGDYVRTLRDRPDLRSAVRTIVRDVESVQFGATPPSEPAFRSVLERILPLVGRALGFVVFCFGLSVALSCTSDQRGGSADTSPSGTRAIIDVMSKHHVTMRHRAEPLSKVDGPMTVVLLGSASPTEAEWNHLLSWVNDKGGHLILASPLHAPQELNLYAELDSETSTELTVSSSAGVALPSGLRLASTKGAAPPEDVLALRKRSVVAIDRAFGAGRLVVFADPRMFTNIALTVRENAAFLLEVLRGDAPEATVELCDDLTGLGAATPFESVSHANLTPVVVQLFVLLALLFLWKGIAFATLRDPPADARRAFADHARALGLVYQRARASRHVAGLYAVWALDRLRERVHRSGRQGLIPLAEGIAARTGRSETEVMRVLVEATSARDEAAPPSSFRAPFAKPAKPSRAERAAADAADLALMNELSTFLAATGSKSAADPSPPPNDPIKRRPR